MVTRRCAASGLAILAGAVVMLNLAVTLGTAQRPTQPPVRRARPPRWDKLPANIFFEDAFRDGLRGKRPAVTRSSSPRRPAVEPPPEPERDVSWSNLISAESIEDEVKRIELELRDAVRNEGHFRGQGHQDARRLLHRAAILFAVIDGYDGSVRWANSANSVWQRCLRTARNAKANSPQVYRGVQQRRDDLFDLIRGGSIPTGDARAVEWHEMVDHALLMKDLELFTKQTAQQLAAAQLSDAETNAVIRQAELIATLAQLLVQPNMSQADDADYAQMCEDLEEAARRMTSAMRQDEWSQARSALGSVKQSCDACHEVYR